MITFLFTLCQISLEVHSHYYNYNALLRVFYAIKLRDWVSIFTTHNMNDRHISIHPRSFVPSVSLRRISQMLDMILLHTRARARTHAGCLEKNAPRVLYLRINSCCCFRIVRCYSLFPLSRQYKSSLSMTHIHAPSKPVSHCPQRPLKITTPFLVNAWLLRQIAVYTKGLVPCTCLSCQTVGEDFWLVEDESVRVCFGNECTRSQTCYKRPFSQFNNKPSNGIFLLVITGW